LTGIKHVYTLQAGERAHLIPGVGAMVVHPMHMPKIVDAAGKIQTVHLGHPPHLLQRTAPAAQPKAPRVPKPKKSKKESS